MENKENINCIGHFIGSLWVEPFKILKEKYNLNLKFAIINYQHLSAELYEKFPSISIQTDLEFELCKLPQNNQIIIQSKIDLELLEYLRAKDIILNPIVERTLRYIGMKYHSEWRTQYYKIILHSCSIIETFKPDFVFFSEPPHRFGSFLLYIICKYYKIKTIMLVEPMEYKNRIIAVTDYEEGYQFVYSDYKKKISNLEFEKVIRFNEKYESYLLNLKKDYNKAIPSYAKHYVKKGKTKLISFEILDKLKDRNRKKISLNVSLIKRISQRISAYLWHRRLPRIYNKYTKEFNFKTKYIFFALHYQPEQTTSPLGGIYENQWLLIKLLSENIPKDWVVVVKENPYQFIRMDVSQKPFRNEKYYEEIASLNNVYLASMKYNSFDLIDNSLAVVTITGMVGWEAINRGKIAIVFGNATYRECEGVFYIKNLDDLLSTINIINNNYNINNDKIRLYIKTVENYSYIGALHDRQLYENPDLANYNTVSWVKTISEQLKRLEIIYK